MKSIMKLYKFIAPALLLGTMFGFSSCNNEEDDIFDGSAAQRLEEYKKQYASDFTSNGGKWLMEYFSNEEERGYAFVVTFNSNGSVKVSGQNIWMDDMFKTDESLWSIIADNGPVLSFNTYNEVLHLFSTPENIVGPNAPINPDTEKDINEQGTGHGGDYEFVILGLSDDGNTMHLTGKKTLHDIYMRKLDSTADDREILGAYSYAEKTTFNVLFPNMFITDMNDGEQYEVSGGVNGIFNMWPKNGDPVVQTVTMCALVGPDGIRFRKPVGIENAENTDSIVVENFVRQSDGKYVCTYNDQNLVLDCIGLGNIFNMTKYVWHIEENAAGGKFAQILSKIATESKSKMKVNFRGFNIEYDATSKKYALNFRRSGSTSPHYMYCEETVVDDGESVKFNVSTTDVNNNGNLLLQRVSSVGDFIQLFNASDFEFEVGSRFAPSRIKMVIKTNPEDYLNVTLQ